MELKEWFFKKTGIWSLWDVLPYRWSMYYYDVVRPVFKPQNKKIRDSIPRKWADITSLIVEVNFTMIKQFYEDEYLLGIVDWKGSSKGHEDFEEWLKKAYAYICYKRPTLEAERDNSYPASKPLYEMFEPVVDETPGLMYKYVDDGIPYEVKYKDVIRLEEEIKETDTKFLKEMIEYRDYFWT